MALRVYTVAVAAYTRIVTVGSCGHSGLAESFAVWCDCL